MELEKNYHQHLGYLTEIVELLLRKKKRRHTSEYPKSEVKVISKICLIYENDLYWDITMQVCMYTS